MVESQQQQNKMAKNRRTIITEVFDAFAKNDEFDYNEEQLWELFESCVQKKLLKKLSKERDGKQVGTHSGTKTRGKTGYQHFLSEFSDPIPEGMKKREYKGAAWAALTSDEKEEWNQKANAINEQNGFQKKPSIKTSKQENDKFEQELMDWSNADPATRGPMPSRPGSAKSTPTNSPPESPTEKKAKDSDSDSDSDSDDEITKKLKEMKIQKNDSDSDSDSDSESDDDEADEERIEWLKSASPEGGWKKNVSSHFKAWIMFSNPDTFGPDKDNTISPAQFGDFKKQHDYGSKSKDEDAPWHNFLVKNAII